MWRQTAFSIDWDWVCNLDRAEITFFQDVTVKKFNRATKLLFISSEIAKALQSFHVISKWNNKFLVSSRIELFLHEASSNIFEQCLECKVWIINYHRVEDQLCVENWVQNFNHFSSQNETKLLLKIKVIPCSLLATCFGHNRQNKCLKHSPFSVAMD